MEKSLETEYMVCSPFWKVIRFLSVNALGAYLVRGKVFENFRDRSLVSDRDYVQR